MLPASIKRKFKKLLDEPQDEKAKQIMVPFQYLDEFEEWVRQEKFPVEMTCCRRWPTKGSEYKSNDLILYTFVKSDGETEIGVWE